MTKTLQQIKDEVATELGYKSNSVFSAHEQLLINPHGVSYKVISNSIDKIAIRYAQEQNKELVEMLQMWCMDMEERGKAYGDFYTMTKQLIKSATEI